MSGRPALAGFIASADEGYSYERDSRCAKKVTQPIFDNRIALYLNTFVSKAVKLPESFGYYHEVSALDHVLSQGCIGRIILGGGPIIELTLIQTKVVVCDNTRVLPSLQHDLVNRQVAYLFGLR